MSRNARFKIGPDREAGIGPWCATITSCPALIVHCRCKDDFPQAIVDLWTFTHLLGGLITGITTYWLGWWSMFFSVGVAVLWEFFENSVIGVKFVGWLYNDIEYIGDHMWNSIFDVLTNAVGGFITALIMIEAGWVA